MGDKIYKCVKCGKEGIYEELIKHYCDRMNTRYYDADFEDETIFIEIDDGVRYANVVNNPTKIKGGIK